MERLSPRKNARFSVAVVLLGLLSASAFAGPRESIEAAYQRTYQAAALKYLYGMQAHRAATFRAYDADGLEVDLEKEQLWLRGYLRQAIEVKEDGRLLSFRQLDARTVDCTVLDTIEFLRLTDSTKRTKVITRVVTRSKDRWRLTADGWKQTECRLVKQTVHDTALKPQD